MRELGFPVVATSGNMSDEPIVSDEREALERLGRIADVFIVHDRPIVRPVDDSVARVVCGRELLLRRARGYVPAPITLKGVRSGILAMGGHLKSTVALTHAGGAVLSQHIGDLETIEARAAHARAAKDLVQLHAEPPVLAVRDLHPDYASTRAAEASGLPVLVVQHHLAHVTACMAEHGIQPPVLGVAWDGTGYGPDGTVWGGEFLLVAAGGWRRFAKLRPFRLPGGDRAIREPRRTALGLLYEAYGERAFEMTQLAPISGLSPTELGRHEADARARAQCARHLQCRPPLRRVLPLSPAFARHARTRVRQRSNWKGPLTSVQPVDDTLYRCERTMTARF